jgi:hypothetical protein
VITCDADIVSRHGPACGCCGIVRQGDWKNAQPMRLVARIDGRPIWRCDRHVGRNPCCIEGCGRTFAHKCDTDGRGAEDYSWRVMCGRCWRKAPKFMRDALARVRRDAKRQGWTDRHHARHGRLWERCRRAIEQGQYLDQAEIERMFGWDAAA